MQTAISKVCCIIIYNNAANFSHDFSGEEIGFILADNWISKVPGDIQACFSNKVWNLETSGSAPVIRRYSTIDNKRTTTSSDSDIAPKQKFPYTAVVDVASQKSNVDVLQLRVNKRCYAQLRDKNHPPTPALKEKLQRVVKEVSLCDKATSAQLVAFHSSMSRENGSDGSQDFSQEFIDFGLF